MNAVTRAAALAAALRPLVDPSARPPQLDFATCGALLDAAGRHHLTGALRRALDGARGSVLEAALASSQVTFSAEALAALSRLTLAIASLREAGIDATLDASPGVVFLSEWNEPGDAHPIGLIVEPDCAGAAASALQDRTVPIGMAPPGAVARAITAEIGGRAFPVLAPMDRLVALASFADAQQWRTLDLLLAGALTAMRCPSEPSDANPDVHARRLTRVLVGVAEAAFAISTPLSAWAAADPDARSLTRSVAAMFTADPGTHDERATRTLVLHQHQSPGDLVMLTAAIRDLHALHPGRFVTDVRTPSPDLWRHNPYVTSIPDHDEHAEHLYCEYPLIHRSNQTPVHFLWGFTEFLSERLGVAVRPTAFKGDIHLSDDERAAPSQIERITGADVPFWIVAAGGKQDFTIKWWDTSRYQEVVDRLRGRVLFVQVGEAGHHHPPLEGVIDLRGRTSLRDLIALMHHAEGVLTPVSLLMHLAAAVPTRHRHASRACVVVAGGREPVHWEQYPGHTFLHTIGMLPCCASGGCWRSRALPLGDGDDKDRPEARCVDVVDALPHCMEMIAPDAVVGAIEERLKGGTVRALTAALFARAAPHLSAGNSPPRAPAVHTAAIDTTIATVTFGDYAATIERCLASIRQHCPRGRYRIVVGANGVSDRSRGFLLDARRQGAIDRLHDSPLNLGKAQLMRRMLADIDTPYIWWLDDDAQVREPLALERRLEFADAAPPDVVIWGERWFHRNTDGWGMAPDMYAFIRAASWYRGRPLPGEPGGPAVWEFITGGCWLARMSALRAIDWPDPRIVQLHTGDDVLMGTAILQQGWQQVDIGALGVSPGHEPRG